jgi:hypothetical protein
VQLGFLDGKQGLVFHLNHALWYRLVEAVKIDEAYSYIAEHGIEAFKAKLARDYNIHL